MDERPVFPEWRELEQEIEKALGLIESLKEENKKLKDELDVLCRERDEVKRRISGLLGKLRALGA